MILNMAKASSTATASSMRELNRRLLVPGLAALLVGAALTYWSVVLAAPALHYAGPVTFSEKTVAAGSEPLLCFENIDWKRLCPGQLTTRLSPTNVSDRKAVPVDLPAHAISTPAATGLTGPKCRAARIPAGLAPGVWKLSGSAVNVCPTIVGNVTVRTTMPEATVIIKP